ncbi:PAQR family membrane homeostasis protein TrhA [Marinobacterium arenosum]|uniref:PAQR family membrane homeostasis protein TrhA n=1 Tax=Marinobacterium arenosum TaxID=2862496 RepID=UPI001C958AA6|nr:hemolysin III family protein [Marinobacterium arenosum]MBY4678732.1 hemolysin III family protein [Marinobacterium arenosum]
MSWVGASRLQTRGEELANSISHGVGFVASAVASPFLILRAVRLAEPAFIVGACVFSATMLLLYLASTFYHALPMGRAKRIFWIIEHSAIFLLIAGTYTPFTLTVLPDEWGWSMLAMVWALAVAGIALKTLGRLSHPVASASLYLVMGWLVLIAIDPLMEQLHPAGLAWLLAGGICYTVGVLFFVTDALLRYGHFIWHLFVIAGTSCHFVAVYRYAVAV